MTDMQKCRVVIGSDQAIFLRGLAALVIPLPGMELIGEARNTAETMQLCEFSRPDLLLLDLKTTLHLRREVARQIHLRWPQVKIALFTHPHDDPVAAHEDAHLFYISRDVDEEELRDAIQKVRAASIEKNQSNPVFGHLGEPGSTEPVNMPNGAPRQSPQRTGESLTRELVMAGKIQADILPEVTPSVPGYDIAARLEPARETSGDFYDFIPFGERKLGILVADVTDKGMGAALFMALSSTLLRTYAVRYPTLPALTLTSVSERILSDTRGSMFVTAFFAILEPHTGRLVYANAGHPPGYLICSQKGRQVIEEMRPTGMALGISEQAQWRQKNMRMEPGDFLILYTDGVTEAQNQQGEFFEEDRLLDAALSRPNGTAQEILDAVISEVRRFTGDSAPQDDIAIIVIRREK